MDTESLVSILVPTGLFFLSELLAILPTNTSGLVQTLFLGLGKSFKVPDKDIEMAKNIVCDGTNAKLMNTISINPQLKNFIDYLVLNPNVIPFVSQYQMFPTNVLELMQNNRALFGILNEQLIQNLHLLSESPHLSSTLNKFKLLSLDERERLLGIIDNSMHTST